MDYTHIHWYCDYKGYEVDYNDIEIVGLYCLNDIPEIYMYIDTETFKILKVWIDDGK